jgi:hypothetical protein
MTTSGPDNAVGPAGKVIVVDVPPAVTIRGRGFKLEVTAKVVDDRPDSMGTL